MSIDQSEPAFEFDVALSFAGEDRAYVAQVAAGLHARDVRCFFDEHHLVEMWGADLYVFLDEVYRKRSRYAVLFASRNYARKSWTDHERQSIQARAIEEKMPYVLPVRLDDSEVPGLRPTIGYFDARKISVDNLVDVIVQKVRGREAARMLPVRYQPKTPRTPEEMVELLGRRPPGWEYLMHAGTLLLGRDALEEKYRDHSIRYARRTGVRIPEADCSAHLDHAFQDATALAESMMRVLDKQALERAFGRPGEPGDPDLIQHLGQRLMEIYGDFMNWAAELRGASVPARFRRAFDLAARFVDGPIEQFREFVDRDVEEMDALSHYLAQPEPSEPKRVELRLTLTIDDDVVEDFNREMRRLRGSRFWGGS
jgi:hypothetical protein